MENNSKKRKKRQKFRIDFLLKLLKLKTSNLLDRVLTDEEIKEVLNLKNNDVLNSEVSKWRKMGLIATITNPFDERKRFYVFNKKKIEKILKDHEEVIENYIRDAVDKYEVVRGVLLKRDNEK